MAVCWISTRLKYTKTLLFILLEETLNKSPEGHLLQIIKNGCRGVLPTNQQLSRAFMFSAVFVLKNDACTDDSLNLLFREMSSAVKPVVLFCPNAD